MFVSVIKFVCSMEYVYIVQTISGGYLVAIAKTYFLAYLWVIQSDYRITDVEIKKFNLITSL
jgi:hypothetical protein